MDRFIAGDVLWPAGETRLHIYLLPEPHQDDGLAGLVDNCRRVFTRFDFLVPVPDEWLHATVQMVTGRPAARVDDQTRQTLAGQLAHDLTGVPPFTLRAGGPSAGRAGVVLDLDGDLAGGPFHEVYRRARDAISTVFGPDAIAHDTMPGHIALAYANGPGDSGHVQSALRRQVRPSSAPMSVHSVHLLDVVQDAAANQYRWHPIASIPLTG